MASRDQNVCLVVIPSETIAEYEQKGRASVLAGYYNPAEYFESVIALSPLEEGVHHDYGMRIEGVSRLSFHSRLKEVSPDIVRAYGGFWAAELACRERIPGIPVVVSVHDPNPALLFDCLPYADLVICMSLNLARVVEKRGVEKSRIRVLPNRINLDIFKPVEDEVALSALRARFPAGKAILHVGRPAPEKNIDTLMLALKRLSAEYYCVFAGPGDSGVYKALARELQVEDRCFWVGAVANAELPLWYSWCDCMCVPSRWEGFGLVFLEAAGCGAAIVTSDITPMNGYLTHGQSAHLVKDYENPEALAAALVMVCENREYRKTLSRAARVVASGFSKARVDAMEVAIYKEAMQLRRLGQWRRAAIRWWQIRKNLDDRVELSRRVFLVRLDQLVRRLRLGWPGSGVRMIKRAISWIMSKPIK